MISGWGVKIKFCGRILLGHQGSRRWDIPDKNFMQVAFFCCFRHGVAGMSWDLGWDVRTWKNFMQENFGLIFRSLIKKKQKPQPPLLLRKVSQYTSNLFCNSLQFPICIALLPVPLRSEERELLSVRLPFVLQYASHLYRNTFGKILVVVVTGMLPIINCVIISERRVSTGSLRSAGK